MLIAGLSFCATNVSTCANITSGQWDLNTSLTGSPNPASEMGDNFMACIKIKSDNVILDCHGFSISNGVGANTSAIMSDAAHSNITVRNCILINYTIGLFLNATNVGLIDNNSALNCSGVGLTLPVPSSSYVNLTNNFINSSLDPTGNIGPNGFVLNYCSYCQVRNNRFFNYAFTNPNANGFSMVSFMNGSIINNTEYNDQYGFFLGIYNVTFANNTATNNGLVGFYISGNQDDINHNNASFNQASGEPGFKLIDMTNSSVMYNTADNNNGGDGFQFLSNPTTNLTVSNNIARNNVNGFNLSAALVGGSFLATVYNNTATNNTGSGFILDTSSYLNLTNNNASNNGYGIELNQHCDNNTFFNNTADGNSNSGFFFLFGSPGSFSNNRFLNNSASHNNGTGFVMYNSFNSTLFGDTISNNKGHGLYINGRNNTVTQSTINGNGVYGVYLDNARSSNITSDTAANNGEYDLYVSALEDANCTNTVSGLTGTGGGLVVYSFTPVNLASITRPEIFLCNADGSNLTTLTISGGSIRNNGMVLISSENVLVSDSTSSNNYIGIYARDSNNTRIIHNTASGNNDSGIIVASYNAMVANNTADNNDIHGFSIASDSNLFSSQTLNNNSATGNHDSGFDIESDKNTLSINHAISNDVNGFFLKTASNNTFNGDTAIGSSHQQIGFNISASSSNNFTNIQSYGNTLYGVDDYTAGVSSDNTYTNPTVHDNYIGILFSRTDSNSIIGGTIYSNSAAGLVDRPNSDPGVTVIGSWFYNNPIEISEAMSGFSSISFVINDTLLGQSPQVNISVSDLMTVGGFDIFESSEPTPTAPENYSGLGRYVKINFTNDEPVLDTLSIHYLTGDIGALNPSTISLWIWNDTSWVNASTQVLNQAGRTITAFSLANLTSDDIYGVFAEGTRPTPPSGGPTPTTDTSRCPSDLSIVYGCGSFTVTALNSEGNPIQGAMVEVYNASQTTDLFRDTTGPDGKVTFSSAGICGGQYTISATHTPCDAIIRQTTTIQCGGPTCGCNTDADCKTGEYCDQSTHQCKAECQCTSYQTCENHQCKNEPCAGGQCDTSSENPNCHCSGGKTCDMQTRTCKAQCSQDSDCASGQFCDNGQCRSGCSSDDECASTQYCDGTTHACTDLGCGRIENHNLVERWDCGGDNCPACTSGTSCDASTHTCKQGGNLTGPTSGFVGENVTVSATVPDPTTGGTKPCAFCTVSVEQGGKTVQVTTDANGKAVVRLLSTGAVKFTLLSTNGVPTASLEVQSLQKTAPGTNAAPTLLGMLTAAAPYLIGILIVATILFLIWRSRKGEKFKPMRK